MALVSDGKKIPEISKSAFDDLDYSLNWKPDAATLLLIKEESAWLKPSEIIVSSQWVVPFDVKLGLTSFDDTTTTAWISGGTKKKKNEIFNEIVTNSTPPRTVRRSFILKIT